MRNFLITLILAAAVFAGLEISIKSFEVFDISMQPTYKEGDFIIVNRLAYLNDMPKRGDVVALYAPGTVCNSTFDRFLNPDSAQYIKRIVALPGDTVKIDNEKVIINGVAITEPYISEPPDYILPEQTIPDGQYFVLGDNRNNSYDSHRGWLAEPEDITGQVCFCYWSTKYPDIHFAVIPLFIVIIGIYSVDALSGSTKNVKPGPGRRF